MGLIKYNEESVLDTKNRVDICNEQMIDALEIIMTEFNNMSSTVDTPKSNQAFSQIMDYYNEKLEFMRNSRDNFNKIFDTITTNYDDYLNNVKEMVGGKNGN